MSNDKEKVIEAAELISRLTQKLVLATHSDAGMFICTKGGGMGMFFAGAKDEFSDRALPFMKLAVERLQEVIKKTESGQIDMTADKAEYIYNTKNKEFVPLDQTGEDGVTNQDNQQN